MKEKAGMVRYCWWPQDNVLLRIYKSASQTQTTKAELDGFLCKWVQRRKWAAVLVATAPIPGVVEEAAVPETVLSSGWRMEETGVGPVEEVQAVLRVLGGVAVNHVQQHHDAHRMSHVDHLLQLLWVTVATAERQTRPITHQNANNPSQPPFLLE